MAQLLWRTFWQFSKMTDINTPYYLVIPLLCIYPREKKHTFILRFDTYVHSFMCNNQKKEKKPNKFPATGEWINKLWCHLTMEYYSAIIGITQHRWILKKKFCRVKTARQKTAYAVWFHWYKTLEKCKCIYSDRKQ